MIVCVCVPVLKMCEDIIKHRHYRVRTCLKVKTFPLVLTFSNGRLRVKAWF